MSAIPGILLAPDEQRGLAWPAVAIPATAILVGCALWWLGADTRALGGPDGGLAMAGRTVAGLGLVGALAATLACGGVWSVARHTFVHCFRMKIAGVFIVILLVVLLALPSMLEGDGTLAGRVRTFLAYGTMFTSVLLMLVTLLVSVAVVAWDVRDRTVFGVVTRPVPRWQYILGRWLGVVAFDVVLLAASAGALYGFSQHLRSGEALNPSDRRIVESEIFTARREVLPEPIDIDRATVARIRQWKEEGRYESILQSWIDDRAGGNRQRAEELLIEEVRRNVAQERQSARPMGTLQWRFEGIDVAGTEASGIGTIARVSMTQQRVPNRDGTRLITVRVPMVAVETDRKLLGQMTFQGPVQVAGFDGKVMDIGSDGFWVELPPDIPGTETLEAGQSVDITVPPTLQVSYKLKPVGGGTNLRSEWQAHNPETGALYWERGRDDPADMKVTLTVPAPVVDDDGVLRLAYRNRSRSSVMIPESEIRVLYKVGSFEANFLRGMGLLLLRLMFVAGVGVLAGSCVSFPVGSVAGVMVILFGAARGFLEDALKLEGEGITYVINAIGRFVMLLMSIPLPDLSELSPADPLVGGVHISPWYLGDAALVAVAWRLALLLALAAVIFRKRELAQVQAQ